jgi:glyoxylase-like metal-dependent hydrolase (beta-lactamase superfamily II)
MRRATLAVSIAAALTLPATTAAQSTSHGNASARATLGRALDAMGGSARLASLGATRRRWVLETRDAWQGLRPVPRDSAPVLERAEGSWIHDPAARRALILEQGTIFGGQPYARRRAVSDAGGFFVQDSVRRIDSLSTRSATAALASLERQLPETLLAQAWDRRHRLQPLPGGSGEERIAYATDDGTQLILVFDRHTGLPLMQEQMADHAALGDYVYRVRYDDWREVGGVRLPFRHVEEWVSGSRVRTMRELVPGIRAADAVLEPPAGYAGPPQVSGESTALGPGVRLLPGSYNSLLVEFADHFVVVEPAQGTRAAEGVMREAARLAPGKPIRYVVATHFHDDHLAGVRPYIAAGATILTTPHGAGAVREIAAVRKGMFPDTLDLAPRELRVEGIVLRRVLQDATQRLEIHEAGPSPHVEQMLVVWIPRAGVLYEADLLDLDVAEDGAPMPGTDTRTFASWLDRVGLPVRVIVPAHGRPGNPADLRRALAR